MGVFVDSTGMETAVLSLALLLALYWYFTSKFNFWKERGVVHIKPVPIFGNMAPFILSKKCSGELLMDIYNSKEATGSPYVGLWMARNPFLMAIDPDFIKQVLIKDFQYFSDRGTSLGNQPKEPLNGHLFNLGGWRWRVLRTKLTPTFTSGKMKFMFGTMVDCAERLDKLLEKLAAQGGTLEVKEPLAKFTTDVIGTCAFGLDMKSMDDDESEFRKMGRSIFSPSFSFLISRFLTLTFPFLVKYIRLTFIPKRVSDFFMAVVVDTVNYRKENNLARNDMMQLLIDIQNQGPLVDEEDKYATLLPVPKDDKGHQVFELTNSLLAAQAFVFFVAGFETSSTTMSFALYELAKNPVIQKKVVEEIHDVLKKHGGVITYESLHDMQYLDMVVSETLRKYPPVQNLFRSASREYRIPDTDIVLPAGVRVFIPAYAIHNDPKYYPNPEKFDPERFTPEMKQKRHPCTYLPFGEGPRNCIGARFGILQTKLGLATTLRKFKLEVCADTIIPVKLDPRSLITAVRGGVNLKISFQDTVGTT